MVKATFIYCGSYSRNLLFLYGVLIKVWGVAAVFEFVIALPDNLSVFVVGVPYL